MDAGAAPASLNAPAGSLATALAHGERAVHSLQDDTGYSFAYDQQPSNYAAYDTDAAENLVNPSQRVAGNDHFNRQSHEPRVISPGGDAYMPGFPTNFEVGFKNQFSDRKFTLNATLFYEKWENFQFGFFGQNGLIVINNLIGSADVCGLEADAAVVPARGLTINGGLAHANARTGYEPQTFGIRFGQRF